MKYPIILHGGGKCVDYDPEKVLPPDIGAECMAQDAVKLIQWARLLRGDTYDQPSPVRLLIPGVGSGIIACSIIVQLMREGNYLGGQLCIDAFDLSPDACKTADRNVRRFMDLGEVTLRIWQHDWQDRLVSVPDNSYDVIMVNPPYLPEGRKVPDSYNDTPGGALYAGDDGLEAYRYMLPGMIRKLDQSKPGSFAMGRCSATLTYKEHVLGEDMDMQAQRVLAMIREHFSSNGISVRSVGGVVVDDRLGIDPRWVDYFVAQMGVPWSSELDVWMDGIYGIPQEYTAKGFSLAQLRSDSRFIT
jgi:methylase of polypeptide subunit release factors